MRDLPIPVLDPAPTHPTSTVTPTPGDPSLTTTTNGIIDGLAIIFAAAALIVLFLIWAKWRRGDQELTEQLRSLGGAIVVITADAAVMIAAIVAATHVGTTSSNGISIMTGAFTAVTAVTTAYLGIKAASNTAQAVIRGRDGHDGPSRNDGHVGRDGQDGRDGRDGHDGRDGRDGNDGRDGRAGRTGG